MTDISNENFNYYLRSVKHCQWLAYPLRLAVELGSCVDGEAHGWAWKPYGWFDPAPRPRDTASPGFCTHGEMWRSVALGRFGLAEAVEAAHGRTERR